MERIARDGGTFAAGQMHVQFQIPAERRHRWPVVMVHGGGGQGLDFLGTPDGRPGWATAFLHHGYAVFVVDRPGLGRAPYDATLLGPATPTPSYEQLSRRFTAPSRQPDADPAARRHTQWPGSGEIGDPALDQFMAGQAPFRAGLAAAQEDMRRCATALLDRIGPAILLTHSMGAPFGWLAADARPGLVRAIVAVEPLGPPFAETALGALAFGLTAVPLALERLQGFPIAVVTGEASWMARHDPRSVAFLAGNGATVEHLRLEEHGLHGNGHIMMAERNSDAIADLLATWLQERVGAA